MRIAEQPNVVAIQESKCNEVTDSWMEFVWGDPDFKFIQKPKVGKSGGMFLIWDTTSFEVNEAVEGKFFLAVKGKWMGRDKDTIITNIYGPHNGNDKKEMWESLEKLMEYKNAEWVLCGDFNEVRVVSKRLNYCGDLSVVTLDRNTSDHCPIFLSDKNINFGPKPFKVFDTWLDNKDVEQVIIEAWNKSVKGSLLRGQEGTASFETR
ncbi:uncharacterized protein [Rutidosis leptorrhynchoides]|uniref:uncharacterized protein n=1 Tax=Rutidosis leptorrhynchoides TaxID=125765 RepID=UPI003A99B3C8